MEKPSWAYNSTVRHRKITDAFFDEGSEVCWMQFKQFAVYNESENYLSELVHCGLYGCQSVFDSLSSFEAHYKSLHQNICMECRRSFPTNHLLEVHIQEWHDPIFSSLQDRKFRCLVEGCIEKFASTKERKNHLVKFHYYPANFRFDRQKPSSLENKAKNASQSSGSNNSAISEANLKSQRRFNYSIPKEICFGHGAQKSFQSRFNKNKKKHWHQFGSQAATSVNIEEVNMRDLSESLL